MLLSFVIPCYGSQDTIGIVCGKIFEWISNNSRYDCEIVTVNDCSPDGLQLVLDCLAEENSKIKVIELAQNKGKHAAMMAGFSIAKGDLIVNLDDDGQCPLEHLSKLIEAINGGADIAMAKYPTKKQSLFKNFCSWLNRMMSQVLVGQPKELDITNFSVLKRFVVDEILRYQNPYPYMNGLFVRATKYIVGVDMEQHERLAGRGGYTFIKSLKLFLDGFTAFSVKPLRIATVLGTLCACIGFVVGLYTIVNKLLHPLTLAGYSSLMATLLFIGGMIMMMLGLIGEYIGRIYISINNSPQYVIRKTIGAEHTKNEEVKSVHEKH